MYGISRKIHERFINRKSKKHDEKYTVPFPTDIPNPNIVVFGTHGSGKCRMPLRIREIYCDQKEITNPFATKPTGFEVQTADDEDFKCYDSKAANNKHFYHNDRCSIWKVRASKNVQRFRIK